MTPPFCWHCLRRMARVAYRRSTATWLYRCPACRRVRAELEAAS